MTDYLAATGRGRGEADFLNLWAEFHAGSLAALDAAAGRADTPAVLWSSHLTRPPYVESYVDKDRWVQPRPSEPTTFILYNQGFWQNNVSPWENVLTYAVL